MKRGMLISFEGGEACGKSTQVKMLVHYLREKGLDVLGAKEPGGTLLGEAIRQVLLHTNLEISSKAEALLFNASRAQLILDVIKPALKESKIVVLDRFYDSTYAYEGYAGNINPEELKPIIDFAVDGAVPDVTFLLDIGFDEARMRKAADEKLKNLDRVESKSQEYHEKVRQGFKELVKKDPERFYVIDAMKSVDEVFEIVKKEVERRYNLLQQK